MGTFNFYDDPGLTTLSTEIRATLAADGTSAPVDRVVYLGSTAAGKKLVDTVNPGVSPIIVWMDYINTDLSELRLSTTLIGLDSASPGGAPPNIGATILSGVGNAVPVYMRLHFPARAIGVTSDLRLIADGVAEVDV